MLGMDEARTGEDPFEFSQSDSESAIAAAAATDKGGSEPAWSAEEAMIFEQALQQVWLFGALWHTWDRWNKCSILTFACCRPYAPE
eukprot:2230288-Rhodomonas_salina.2